MIAENIFNVCYLIVVWWLVVYMTQKIKTCKGGKLLKLFRNAFFALALGDSGHVGFRVVAFLNGGIDKNAALVGLGSLFTAITCTIFYLFMLAAWKERFNRKYGIIAYILIFAAVIRYIIMAFPQNQWFSIVPPFNWSVYRNVPLMALGIGAALLILADSVKANDKTFFWISIMIFVSYACYTPVIFLIQRYPMIGMLMIPKTLAYLGVGFVGVNGLFKKIAIVNNQKIRYN